MLCTELNLSTRHDSHAPHVKLRAHASFAPLVLYSHALHAALCRYDDLFGFIFNSVLDANAVKQVRTTHKARPRVESVVSAVSAVPCCLNALAACGTGREALGLGGIPGCGSSSNHAEGVREVQPSRAHGEAPP